MDSKKRVLHLLRSSEYAGAENVAITIIQAFRNEYDMIYVSSDGSIKKNLEAAQIRYVLLKNYSRKEILRVIRKFRPDIVHAHDYTASVLAASLKKDFLLVSHLHNDPLWVRSWNPRTLLFTFLLGRMDRIIVVSEAAYRNFVFRKHCKKKTQVIHNPLDKAKICRLAGSGRENKKYDLIFCGRMSEQKDPERFVEIIRSLVANGLDVRAVMLGRGSLLEACRKKITAEHLEGNIEILGFVENPYQYMAQSKILCMTSRWEGFGLVAAEASALGVPVLATRAVGLLTAYKDGVYAYCDSNADFCRKIRTLLQDEKAYEKFQASFLSEAERLPDVALYKQKIRAVYGRGKSDRSSLCL